MVHRTLNGPSTVTTPGFKRKTFLLQFVWLIEMAFHYIIVKQADNRKPKGKAMVQGVLDGPSTVATSRIKRRTFKGFLIWLLWLIKMVLSQLHNSSLSRPKKTTGARNHINIVVQGTLINLTSNEATLWDPVQMTCGSWFVGILLTDMTLTSFT